MNTAPTSCPAVVGWSAAGQPRTYRLSTNARVQRDASYRRLAAVVLGLDVAFLAQELQGQRRAKAAELRSAA